MIVESVKEGLRLTGRNYQLVFIRIIASTIAFVSLFLFLAVPVLTAIAYLGVDMAQLKDLLPLLASNPFAFFSKYLVLIVLAGTSFACYLTLISILYVYVLGGTLGVLKRSAVNVEYTFSFPSFFREANANFSRVLWLMSLVILAIMVILAVLLVMGGLTAAIVGAAAGSGSSLEVFFSSFAFMSFAVIGIFFLLAGFAFTGYSVVILIVDGKGIVESVRRTVLFFRQSPRALLFYGLLLSGVIAANTVYYGIQLSFIGIPLMAPLFYLLNIFFQSCLSILVWSLLIAYYIKVSGHPVYSSTYEI